MDPVALSRVRVLRTLRSKIIALTFLLSFLTAAMIGGLAHVRTAEIALETSTARLEGGVRVMAQRLDATVQSVARDLLIVSRSPAISGSLRARQAGSVEIATDDRADGWNTQLVRQFSSLMLARESYASASLLGVWQGGNRILDVQRTANGMVVGSQTPHDDPMQTDLLSIASGLRVGEVHLTYAPDPDDVARGSLILLTPIAHMGSKIALMRLRIDPQKLLQPLVSDQGAASSILLADESGSVFTVAGPGLTGAANLDQADQAAMIDVLRGGGQDDLVPGGHDHTAFLSATVPQQWINGARLGAVIEVDRPTLLAPARAAQRTTLALSAALCVLALTLSTLAAHHLTRPLNDLTNQIMAAKSHDGLRGLPTRRRDEIGDLSRAFRDLMGRLTASETGAREILDTVEHGIVVVGDDGVIQNANPGAGRIFDCDAPGMSGCHISKFVAPVEDDHSEKVALPETLTRLNLDGVKRHLALTSTIRHDLDRPFTTIVIRDVTEAREMELRKSEFIATVSHELRTPLTGIRSSLLLLRHAAGSIMPEKAGSLLQMAINNTDRLARLVDDILSVEKAASGKMTYRMEPLELGAFIDELVDANIALGKAHGVIFEVDRSDVPVHVLADRVRLYQVMMNLMSNAAKFSDGGDRVILRVSSPATDAARISVIDRGTGIPLEFRNRIFDRFARADSSSNAVQAGTGLGLNIARSMVQAMDGALTFETETGGGTTFHVDLSVTEQVQAA